MGNSHMRLIFKSSLVLFTSLLIIFSIINSVALTVNNKDQQLFYHYSLSLTGTTTHHGCNNDDQKYSITKIHIFSVTGNSIASIGMNQQTSCHDLLSADNLLSMLHIDIVKQVNKLPENFSNLYLMVVLSLIISILFGVILHVVYYLLIYNKYLYEHYQKLFNWVLLLELMILFGSYSLLLGQDLNWDLANYHFYNGWAFINNRLYIDVTPNNGLHGYFSPILDSIFYVIMISLSPRTYALMMGAISGVSIFICYLISKLLFKEVSNIRQKTIFIICSTIIAATNAPNLMQLGTFTNEVVISLLIIYAIYLIMLFDVNYKRTIFFSGILLGIAVGFKLTAVIVVMAILCSQILFRFDKYNIALISFAVILGFLITDGLWMYKMYNMFGNPIFPNFGKYINPNTAIDFQRDTTFIPKDIFHWLFMPFYLLFPSKLTAEGMVSEPRFLLAILVGIIALFQSKRTSIRIDKNFILHLSIFIIAYIAWLVIFSIIRYTIVLGFLTGFIIAYGIYFIFHNHKFAEKLIIIITFIILLMTKWYNLGHISYSHRFYDSNIKITDSLLIFNENPTSYIIPHFGTSNVYINAPNLYFTSKFDYMRKDKIINDSLSEHKDIYLVMKSFDYNQYSWISSYGLVLKEQYCQKFNDVSNIYICRLIRINK